MRSRPLLGTPSSAWSFGPPLRSSSTSPWLHVAASRLTPGLRMPRNPAYVGIPCAHPSSLRCASVRVVRRHLPCGGAPAPWPHVTRHGVAVARAVLRLRAHRSASLRVRTGPGCGWAYARGIVPPVASATPRAGHAAHPAHASLAPRARRYALPPSAGRSGPPRAPLRGCAKRYRAQLPPP